MKYLKMTDLFDGFLYCLDIKIGRKKPNTELFRERVDDVFNAYQKELNDRGYLIIKNKK